jgi:hypothetical protein
MLWEKRRRVGYYLDHFTGFVNIGTTPAEEMAKFIVGNVTFPIARGALPDPAF